MTETDGSTETVRDREKGRETEKQGYRDRKRQGERKIETEIGRDRET